MKNIDLDSHLIESLAAIEATRDLERLNTLDSVLLGKKSVITLAKKNLSDLDADERRSKGKQINEIRDQIKDLIASKRTALVEEHQSVQLENERLDLTELDSGFRLGHHHVITQTWERLEDLFVGMGYTVSEGPEIEDEWHNFGALNFPLKFPLKNP